MDSLFLKFSFHNSHLHDHTKRNSFHNFYFSFSHHLVFYARTINKHTEFYISFIVNFIAFSGQSYYCKNNMNWLTAKTIMHLLDESAHIVLKKRDFRFYLFNKHSQQ